MNENNPVEFFCNGEKRQFNGEQCEFYNQKTHDCELLRRGILQSIFEKGRCKPHNIVKTVVAQKLHSTYQHLYRDFPDQTKNHSDRQKHAEALAFIITEEYLKPKRMTPTHGLEQGYTLHDLEKYITKVSRLKLIDLLQAEGLLSKRHCGECIYLPSQKPFVCQREFIIINQKEEQHPRFGQKRRPSDRACREGFESNSKGVYFDRQESSSEARLQIEDILFLLEKRAKGSAGAKQQEIYNRQHQLFIRILQLLSGSLNRRECIEIISKELGKSIKTIDRDLSEIKEFIERKSVL